MSIRKQQDESLAQYHVRLFGKKDEYGIDSDQIAELLNKESGFNYTESKWRKDYAQYCKWKEFILDNEISETELLEELKQKTKEFEIAKIQMQDQKREYRAYLRHEGRLEHLLQTMLESIKEDLHTKKPLEWINPINVHEGNGALTLLLSDLHKGMVTNNHWNKFNDEVFYKRLNQVRQEVIDYKEITGANELHVLELGDTISGLIHRLTKITETENAVESTQKVAEALSELLSFFSNHFGQVHYYSVKGNHDRVSARKEEEVRTESFHDFIVWYMKARLEKHENVTFHDNEVDSEILIAEIQGHTYFGVHGHLEGLGKVVHDLTMMTRKFPTAVFLGHYHKNYENEIHGVDLVMNGSFGGTDDYAKDKRLLSKAHQKLLWLNEKGRRATFYINLD